MWISSIAYIRSRTHLPPVYTYQKKSAHIVLIIGAEISSCTTTGDPPPLLVHEPVYDISKLVPTYK